MTIMQRFSFSRLTLLLACLLLPGLVQAATYTFGQGFFSTHSPPPCQGGTWSNPNSGSTYICSGRVVLAAGDVVIVSTAWFEPLDNIVIRAAGGFTLAGNSIGTSGKNISLETDYSTITATGTNNINGSVKGGSGNVSFTAGTITGSLETASGSITLNGTTVNGTLTSSGPNNLTNATIGIGWQAWDNGGFTLGYMYYDVDADAEKGSLNGSFNFSYDGPYLGARFNF